MNPAPTIPIVPTEQRLLEAAARIFALKGIEGASTREIAREAEVNEVTLFRKFGNKDGLVAAVVENIFGQKANLVPENPIPESYDLRRYLLEYVQIYSNLIASNLPLIRTMIGEIHRFQDYERQVFKAIFRPFRQRMVDRLKRENASASEIMADQLNSMIFMDALRRSSTFCTLEYTKADFLQASVELILASLRGAQEV